MLNSDTFNQEINDLNLTKINKLRFKNTLGDIKVPCEIYADTLDSETLDKVKEHLIDEYHAAIDSFHEQSECCTIL